MPRYIEGIHLYRRESMEKIPFHSVWFETEIVALEIKGT